MTRSIAPGSRLPFSGAQRALEPRPRPRSDLASRPLPGDGVRARDYDDAGAALVRALHVTRGQRMSDDIADAWRELFRVLAAVMIRATAD